MVVRWRVLCEGVVFVFTCAVVVGALRPWYCVGKRTDDPAKSAQTIQTSRHFGEGIPSSSIQVSKVPANCFEEYQKLRIHRQALRYYVCVTSNFSRQLRQICWKNQCLWWPFTVLKKTTNLLYFSKNNDLDVVREWNFTQNRMIIILVALYSTLVESFLTVTLNCDPPHFFSRTQKNHENWCDNRSFSSQELLLLIL